MRTRKSVPRNGFGQPTRQDLDKMREIFKDGQIQHHQAFPEIFCQPDNEEKIRVYLEGFLKPRNPFRSQRQFSRAWFENDELQGYILYQLYQSSDIFFGENRWFAYVDDIAVDEGFRKNGIASKLLNDLIEQVNTLGGGIVSGQVWDQNISSEILFEKAKFKASAKQFYRVI